MGWRCMTQVGRGIGWTILDSVDNENPNSATGEKHAMQTTYAKGLTIHLFTLLPFSE